MKITTKNLVLSVLLTSSILLPLAAYGQNTAPPIQNISQLLGFFRYIARFFFTIFLIMAVIMFVYAAFIFLTAAGDASKLEKAKNSIIWGAIAIAVALMAFSASQFIYGLLQKQA